MGNRKLEDGNLCKSCAGKLSPWFDERRHTTVDRIKEQLAYREANMAEVDAFDVTRTFGRGCTLCLDEGKRKFLVARTRDIHSENPDVIDCSLVTGCDTDIEESRFEEKRTVKKPDGSTEEASYNPPRYEYYYDFYLIIRVNHPYFDDIRFKLNPSHVEIHDIGQYGRASYRAGRSADLIGSTLQGIASDASASNTDPRMRNPNYAEYWNMGQEIKQALMSARQETRDVKAPKAAVSCPHCGAVTIPDASGCCEYCGGAIAQ